MTDFENAMEKARRWCEYPVIRWNERRSNWQADTGVVKLYLNAMAAAHADVVAERDALDELATTLRSSLAAMKLMRDASDDAAHKLARYVLRDAGDGDDTLTIRQLVEAADAVCDAAEEADDDIQA